MEHEQLSSTMPADEGDDFPWEVVETTFRAFLFEPDMEAIRAVYSAIAALRCSGQMSITSGAGSACAIRIGAGS